MTLTRSLSISFLAIVCFFAAAFTAFAYEDLDITIEFDDGKAKVEVSYTDEDDDEVEKTYTFSTTDIDEVYEELAEDLDLTVEDIEAAVSRVEEDEEEDEDEDEEEDEDEDEDEDDDRGHGNDEDGCDEDNPGRGVGLAKRCDDTKPTFVKRPCTEDGKTGLRRFCRDGEWKERREARLDDIMKGFIAAGDLNEEEAAAVRSEVEALIRQLIALMMKNRLGS